MIREHHKYKETLYCMNMDCGEITEKITVSKRIRSSVCPECKKGNVRVSKEPFIEQKECPVCLGGQIHEFRIESLVGVFIHSECVDTCYLCKGVKTVNYEVEKPIQKDYIGDIMNHLFEGL